MPTSPSLLALLLLGNNRRPVHDVVAVVVFVSVILLRWKKEQRRSGAVGRRAGVLPRETGHPFRVTTESGVAPLSWKQGGWAAWRGWAGRRGGFSQSERRFTRAPAETATGRGSRSPWAIRSAGPTPPPARSLTSGRCPCLRARRGGATSKSA